MQNEDKHAHGIYMFLSHGIEKNNMSNYLFLYLIMPTQYGKDILQ